MTYQAWIRWARTAGSLLLVVSACSGSSDDDDDNGGNGASCQQWQGALCNFVERCGVDATTCREQAPAIACLSEAEAQRCSAALDAAVCDGTVPSGCDVSDIADPAPAIAKCNAFIEVFCNRSEECEPGSGDLCVADANEALDCSQALGIKPEYDQCISEVSALDCMAMSSPDACQGVILFAQ